MDNSALFVGINQKWRQRFRDCRMTTHARGFVLYNIQCLKLTKKIIKNKIKLNYTNMDWRTKTAKNTFFPYFALYASALIFDSVKSTRTVAILPYWQLKWSAKRTKYKLISSVGNLEGIYSGVYRFKFQWTAMSTKPVKSYVNIGYTTSKNLPLFKLLSTKSGLALFWSKTSRMAALSSIAAICTGHWRFLSMPLTSAPAKI